MAPEEKAKAYEEALERAKQGKPIDEVFPELKKSDDDIRNRIINILGNNTDAHEEGWTLYADEIAWLRRVQEQKSIKFPDVSGISEDELIAEYSSVLYKTIQHYLDRYVDFTDFNVKADAAITFFQLRRRLSKALENRYQDGYQEGVASLKPTEWSVEDKRHIDRIVLVLSAYDRQYASDIPSTIPGDIIWLENKFKSLLETSHWKPSEEQLGALHTAAVTLQSDVLESLFSSLQPH